MTMLDDEEIVTVGDPLPRILSVAARDGFDIVVTWDDGLRAKATEIVDLAPAIFRYKIYTSLRDDPVLFRTIHLQPHGFGIAWGEQDQIDMGSTTIEDLAEEMMSAEDFDAFMKRHTFSLDSAAAAIGVSRRMAAYYRKEHKVPRTVALACRYIDLKATPGSRLE